MVRAQKYTENSQNLLKNKQQFSKISEHNVYPQQSTVLMLTTIKSQNLKHNSNLQLLVKSRYKSNKNVFDLYAGNYKTLMKEIEKKKAKDTLFMDLSQ